MRPNETSQAMDQGELFRSRLDQILNMQHPLCALANGIDWSGFEEELGMLYEERMGRPGLSTRLMVGLHYLKYSFDESDESVVERLHENPYWQYFCGMQYFTHEALLDPSSLVRWRQRVGEAGMEQLLEETIAVAQRNKLMEPRHLKRVNVDTTVQEKAIAFPTDARLYYKMRRALVRAAKERGIELRQNYERKGKIALQKQGRYGHAKQMKRARRETKNLKNYLGRVLRDIRRKKPDADKELADLLDRAERIYEQQRNDKNKVYSVHAPEVECIAKGKVHKRYEFGCKVSVASTSRDNWIVGIKAFHQNPYDGHTLKEQLDQVERLTGYDLEHVYCDRGYRGANDVNEEIDVHLVGRRQKRLSRWERGWLKRRSAIESLIGHAKSDSRLDRNYLFGESGDCINALLSGCGLNMRKLIRAFFLFFFGWYLRGSRRHQWAWDLC